MRSYNIHINPVNGLFFISEQIRNTGREVLITPVQSIEEFVERMPKLCEEARKHGIHGRFIDQMKTSMPRERFIFWLAIMAYDRFMIGKFTSLTVLEFLPENTLFVPYTRGTPELWFHRLNSNTRCLDGIDYCLSRDQQVYTHPDTFKSYLQTKCGG